MKRILLSAPSQRILAAAVLVLLATTPIQAQEAPSTQPADAVSAAEDAGFIVDAVDDLGDEPIDADDPTTPQLFQIATKTLELEGAEKDGVLTFRVPRTDLDLRFDGGDVPAGAGIESAFHFFRCPCGKLNVIGQFMLADYETNDVVDALRDANIDVASISPAMIGEKPRLSVLRFQGEGTAEELARGLKDALSFTGEARMTTQPME